MSNENRFKRWLGWTAIPIVGATLTLGVSAYGGSWVVSEGSVDRSGVPDWAADACWYQVFVSRFCNGDPANDPRHTWPWTDNWLRQPPDRPPDRTELYFRRYGGDLQGLQARLDYLSDLGVNALYLNPVFAGGSEHKYDTFDYRHIDDTFGVAGARHRLNGETVDPATWQWSDSDRVFLDLLADAHRRKIRVVIDGVFNHVGRRFWAFRDVRNRGRNSPYAEWFDIIDFGPPLRWNAWDGVNGHLVRFARQGDGLHPEVEQHLFAVTRRWMDPNADGDPSDGIDGWRLDAAEQVPHGFWKRWRQVVKEVNPDALILGEIWTNASEWLAGDEFDVITNYRFARAATRFCRRDTERFTPTRLAAQLTALNRQYDRARTLAMVNLLGSHDTDRLVSMMANPGRRYDRDNQPGIGTPPYNAESPCEDAIDRAKLAFFIQFTCPGAPMIFCGDEIGMYGADDPYCRAPMWWPDAEGRTPPGYRFDMRRHCQALLRLRADLASLRHGDFRILLADDARRILAFQRRWRDETVVVVVNASADVAEVRLNLGSPGTKLELLWPAGTGESSKSITADRLGTGGETVVRCQPLAGCVLRLRT